MARRVPFFTFYPSNKHGIKLSLKSVELNQVDKLETANKVWAK